MTLNFACGCVATLRLTDDGSGVAAADRDVLCDAHRANPAAATSYTAWQAQDDGTMVAVEVEAPSPWTMLP